MSTKIDLEFPYSEDFLAGYLNINKEPRRVVLLIKEDGTKTSTSYARYLLSCSLGRYLGKHEHVDHIDNNKLNDVVENLQILSMEENLLKDRKYRGIKRNLITLECPICGEYFTRDGRNVRTKIKRGKTPTCSRTCGGKMSHIAKQSNK